MILRGSLLFKRRVIRSLRIGYQSKGIGYSVGLNLYSIKANPGGIHEQGTIDFFSKLLEDKENNINHLKTQNDVLMVSDKGGGFLNCNRVRKNNT